MTTADSASKMWQSGWTGDLLVLAGLGGILTSWNAFVIGGSRAMYAVANAGHLPEALGRIHPRFKTPYWPVILLGIVGILSPFFGRQALIWIIDAQGLAIVFSYGMVAWTFLVLRKKEP